MIKIWRKVGKVVSGLIALVFSFGLMQLVSVGMAEASTSEPHHLSTLHHSPHYDKIGSSWFSSSCCATVAPKERRDSSDWFATLVNFNVATPNTNEEIISSEKRAAIRELLESMGVSKVISAITYNIAFQMKQLIPLVEADILSEKMLGYSQKNKIMQSLQKYCEDEISERSSEVFRSSDFWSHAVRAQYLAYSRYYTVEELKDLTSFYKSNVGKKFLNFQPQVGYDILDELMKKFVPQSLSAIRIEVEKQIRDFMAVT